MGSHGHVPERRGGRPRHRFPGGFWGRWIFAYSAISGILALFWILLRSGTKPSRFAYPCQQASISMAALAFGAPFAAALLAARRRVAAWVRTPAVTATAVAGLLFTTALWAAFSHPDEPPGPVLDPPRDYRAKLYHVADCPQDPAGDRFVGLDNLLVQMSLGGVKLYESATVTPFAGPDGLLAADDVIVVKINYQWDQRGGTNTDLLRGLLSRILGHPDGFTGELVVCENAQFNSVSNFDRPENNAQDHGLSPHDVVVWFQSPGFDVSHYDWTSVRYNSVSEYSQGDMNDGYVVGEYDAGLHGRVSYPKFQTDAGTRVSLRFGVWNPGAETYDREKLKFVNVPILKSHHAVYGATVSVKHYMGVVTRELSTNSHGAIHYGILGALLGEIQLADLNVLDAIWINANPYGGPSTTYAGATRRDELVASTDPVALDIWAVKNILIPAFMDNGYSPPWPAPSADPDDPGGSFRQYLDNSMYQMLAAGHQVTNDLAQIDVTTAMGAAGDFDGDGDVDADDAARFGQCFTGEDGGPVGPGCEAGDFDGDGDVDCGDWDMFRFVWTEAAPPPDFPGCDSSGSPQVGPEIKTSLSPPCPNPIGPSTRITFAIGAPGLVTLRIVDVSGRVVRTLVNGTRGAGEHTVVWDGRNDDGEGVSSGVYSSQLTAPGYRGSQRIVILE